MFFPKTPAIAMALRERLQHFGGPLDSVYDRGTQVFQGNTIRGSHLIMQVQYLRGVKRNVAMTGVGILASHDLTWVFDDASDFAILNDTLLGLVVPQNLGLLVEFHRIFAKFA
jgi:hypothetical protein